MNMQSNREDNS